MKVIVPIKRVLDYNVKVRVKSDFSDVDLSNLKMSINPFDEIALEQALRWREAGAISSITVVSIGPEAAQETLRTGLAMGADDAVLIKTDDNLQPLAISKLLASVIREFEYDVAIMGKQAIDSDNNQVAQMLAGQLSWPQACFASEANIENGTVSAVREVDGGLEHIVLPTPCVISADLRLNEPRYVTLPNIMKAKRKPLTIRSVEEFKVDCTARIRLLEVTPPPERKPGVMLDSVAELVSKLKTEAKVIA